MAVLPLITPNPICSGCSTNGDPSNDDVENVETDFDYLLLEALIQDVCEGWERRMLLYRPLVVNMLNA